MNEPMLRLEGVEKVYNRGRVGEVRVLMGVSLAVARGEMVALVAPSGAGKSTLLHIAGLLDTADAGTIEIAGRDVTGLGDRARTALRRREVGFVYQFHHLLPEFNARDNVAMPLMVNGVKRRIARQRSLQPQSKSSSVGSRRSHSRT